MRRLLAVCAFLAAGYAVIYFGDVIPGFAPSLRSTLPPLPTDLDSAVARIAQSASADVGVVSHAFAGASGAPVVLMEEFHNSRASQIQHAITLLRLYEQRGMRSIGLEGYVKEHAHVDGRWFTTRWRNQTPPENARVAVQLLQEGEISEAECLQLVFPDITLLPIETEADYNVTLMPDALDAVIEVARRVDSRRARQLERQMTEMEKGQTISAEDALAVLDDIERQRVAKGIQISPTLELGWKSWRTFWRGRAHGNKTMVDATAAAQAPKGEPVAMVIGAAHTAGIGNLFKTAGRPFAIVTPLALHQHDTRGDIEKNYDRKSNNLSLQSEGPFALLLAAAVPTKKPEPVIVPLPWMEVKSHIYQFTDRILNRVAGGAGGGKPPFGFAANEFRTSWLAIDPRQIVYIPDDRGRKTVIFPIVIRPDSPYASRTLWVKAGRSANQTPGDPREDDGAFIERLLKAALAHVQHQADAPAAAENVNQEIQMSTDTVAFVSESKQTTTQHLLASS